MLLHTLLREGKHAVLACVAAIAQQHTSQQQHLCVGHSQHLTAACRRRCRTGLGRACTVAALYLQEAQPGLSGEAAVERVRALRGPAAIQTVRQVRSPRNAVCAGRVAATSGGAPRCRRKRDATLSASRHARCAVERGDRLHATRAAAVISLARRGGAARACARERREAGVAAAAADLRTQNAWCQVAASASARAMHAAE